MMRQYLWAEMILFLVGVPIIYGFKWIPLHLFAFVWLGVVVSGFILWKSHAKEVLKHDLLYLGKPSDWYFTLRQFSLIAFSVSVFVYTIFPEDFLALPRENPGVWLTIMVFYPIFSVLPQTFIYRLFYRIRYRSLFQTNRSFLLFGALVFGLMHLLFRNALAIIMTLVGGFIFLRTFINTRSFALSAVEHALYGNFIFTIGLGRFIYHADN